MSNYNTTLQSNNTDLQAILNTINELPEASGDPVLQDKTVTPTTSSQSITADSGYDGLETVVVEAMPTATQATPSITVNSSGLITATATQTAGYVSAGTKSTTKQLAFQAAKTITPTTVSQTAVSSGYYTGGNITVAGDSNLVAGNIKNGVSIFGVRGNYSGNTGGTSMEDNIVNRTLTSYTNDRVTVIGCYAFASFSSLTTVRFPAVTSTSMYAFFACKKLSSVSFPALQVIGASAFGTCASISTVNFPVTTIIQDYAFASCAGLTTVSFPAVTSIGFSAFYQCKKLSSVSFPETTLISNYAFYYCSGLTSVSFPMASIIGNYAFGNCYSLTKASFPMATSIASYAFYTCSKLSQIYLTNSSVCKLGASNAFSKTSIWSTMGSIFVPSSLVASYKTATNWTYFSNRIYGV